MGVKGRVEGEGGKMGEEEIKCNGRCLQGANKEVRLNKGEIEGDGE